jgi:MYXO-CTERM domain-containing protein
VAMVDGAGNVSEPVAVHASGDAVGCGCAVPPGRPGTAAAGLAVGALLWVRRGRRLVRWFASSRR